MPKAWFAVVAVAVGAMACGGESATTASPTPPASSSPSSSPSPKGVTFRLTPEPGVTANGTITLSADQSTTAIELKVSGLQANSSHVSHIHLGTCQSRGGIAFALNQVVADGQGDSDVRTTLMNLRYPPATGTWYVVVHAGPDMQGSNSSYLLCGNLFS
jgi:Cu/Zn superoxide dismutase